MDLLSADHSRICLLSSTPLKRQRHEPFASIKLLGLQTPGENIDVQNNQQVTINGQHSDPEQKVFPFWKRRDGLRLALRLL